MAELQTLPKGTAGTNVYPQYAACVIVNLLSLIYGSTLRFFLHKQLLRESLYSSNITDNLLVSEIPHASSSEEILWLGKAFYIGGIIGAPLTGYLAHKFGRKKLLIAITIIFLLVFLGNLVVVFSYLLEGAVGIACAGVCIIIPIYLKEIAQDNIRGVLGSYFNLFACLGMLFTTVIEHSMFYHHLGYLFFIYPIIYIIFLIATLFWLPESPTYYLLNNRVTEAQNALMKLRGSDKESVQNELEHLASSITASEKSGPFIKTILDPATRNALIIGFVLLVVRQLSSVNHIMFFREKVWPNGFTILVAVFPVVGAIIATVLIERVGRKRLLLASSKGMASGVAIQVFWLLLSINICKCDSEPPLLWLTSLAHVVYIVSFHVGFGSVPWILLSEMFRTKISIPAMSFWVFMLWIFYLLDMYVSLLLENYHLAILAANCVLGAVFTYYFVPETKGESQEVILTKLGDKETQEKSRLWFDIDL